jgi:hypothetical protein
VWRHLRTQTSVSHGAAEGFLDALDRFAVPLDGEALSASMPAAQMSQKLSRQWNGRLTLFRFSLTCWSAVEHAAIKVDPSSPNCRRKRGTTNRARARASIQSNQNELGNVLP